MGGFLLYSTRIGSEYVVILVLLLLVVVSVAATPALADSADLSAKGESVVSGTHTTISFNLRNTGSSATGYILAFDLPDGFELINHAEDGGTWKPDGTKWLFQTIEAGNSRKPSITLSVPGNASGEYTVRGTVKTADGIEATATAVITVTSENEPPDARLELNTSTVEVGESVEFNASNTTDDGSITEYQWDFDGDNSIESTTNGTTVIHSFDTADEFTPTVTVVDDDGASDSARKTLTVTENSSSHPLINRSVLSISTSQTRPESSTNVTFVLTNTGSDQRGYILDVTIPDGFTIINRKDRGGTWKAEETKWLFQTINPGNTVSPSLILSVPADAAGEYPVEGTVKTAEGVITKNRSTLSVDTTPPVAVAGSNRTVPKDTEIEFNATNSTDNVEITSYEWTFGDGTTGTSATPTHTYTEPGTYTVTLTVTDGAGNTDTDTLIITVQVPANFSVALDSTNSPVIEGENLSVNVTATNTGDLVATQEITLDIGGSQRDSRHISLNGRESQTITLSWATTDGDAGDYTTTLSSIDDTASATVAVRAPAAFNVSYRVNKTTVTTGEAVRVTATIENIGDVSNSNTLSFYAAGEEFKNETVTLDGGNTTTIVATTSFSSPGTYNVTVGDLNKVVITVQGPLVVDGEDDGDSEYTTIQAAVDDATNSDRVEVRSGTYREEVIIDENITLIAPEGATLNGTSSMFDGIEIDENSIAPVIIGFNLTGYGNGLDATGTRGAWVLRNITFVNNDEGVDARFSSGDWMINSSIFINNTVQGVEAGKSRGRWMVRNSTFQNNNHGVAATFTSGSWTALSSIFQNNSLGIYAQGANGDWNVTSSIFRENSRGISAFNTSGDWMVRSSLFQDNLQDGMRVGDAMGAGSVYNTSFKSNSGGLRIADSKQDIIVENTTFQNNSFYGITAFLASGNWSVRESIFRNTTGPGIIARETKGDWIVGNSTFRNNSASRYDTGLYASGSSGNWIIHNSTFAKHEIGVTTGKTIFNRGATGDWLITKSTIINNRIGVSATNTGGNWKINQSTIAKNTQIGISATNTKFRGNASYNYWGARDGPSGDFSGSGDAVVGNVTVWPVYTDANLSSEAQPAKFTTTIVSTNSPVVEGENLTITTNVTNVGDLAGTDAVNLSIGGGQRDSMVVSLDAGHSRNLTLFWATANSDAGNHTATVESDGNTDAIMVTIEDGTVPTADAGPNKTVDEGTSAQFDGTNSTDNTEITSYEWDFGDGSNTTGVSPTHTYSDPGTYTVTLTVIDVAGNTDTDTQTVTVEDTTSPIAEAGAEKTVGEDTNVQFNASGSTDNVRVTSYQWAFGDGTNTTGISPRHTYADPGTYTVTLTVTDNAGNADTDTLTVTVQAAANFSVAIDSTNSPVIEGENLTVVANVTNRGDLAGTTDVNLSIDRDRQYSAIVSVDPGKTTSVVLSWETAGGDAGNYTARLKTDGTTDNVTVTVEDGTAPVAEAGPNKTVDGDTNVQFDASNSTDNVGITSYEWEFGDGSTESGITVKHTYADPGIYTVTLTVTDDAGNTDTDTLVVTVQAPANFSVMIGSTNSPVLEGQPLNVTAVIENAGDLRATQAITLGVNGTRRDSIDVTLAAGENTTVTLSWATTDGDSGNYKAPISSTDETVSANVAVLEPPAFNLSYRVANTTVKTGEDVRVTATIENIGDVSNSNTLSFYAAGGEFKNETVTLDGGNTTTIVATTSFSSPGTYNVTVDDLNKEIITVQGPLVVDGEADGDAEYTTIQTAVDDATDSDRVEVRPGTYHEEVTINNNITLIAPEGATLNGSTSSGIVIPWDTNIAPVIGGFTITGYDDGVQAWRTDGDWIIQNMTIRGEHDGIDVQNSRGDWTIRNTTIRGSSSSVFSSAVFARDSTGDWRVQDTIMKNNTFGVYASGSSGNWTIHKSNIRNSSNSGVGASHSTGAWMIQDSIIMDSKIGVDADESGGNWIIRNTTITNSSWNGVSAGQSSGPWTIRNTTITNSSSNGVYAWNSSGAWEIYASKIISNSGAGLYATDATPQGDATYNYWGAPDGPSGDFTGSGEAVLGNVTVWPFYTNANLRSEAQPGTFLVKINSMTTSTIGGKNFRINITVTNLGDVAATQGITLDVNGSPQDSRRLTLKRKESKTITLSWATTKGDAGEYEVTVASRNNTASASIVIQAPKTCVADAVSGPDDEIDLSEIQQAINRWANGEEVPNTDGDTISLTQIQNLINTWAEGASISCG